MPAYCWPGAILGCLQTCLFIFVDVLALHQGPQRKLMQTSVWQLTVRQHEGLPCVQAGTAVLHRRQCVPCCAEGPGSSDHGLSTSSEPAAHPGQLPLVEPCVSYALLAANLSVYAAGIAIALLDSGEASNEFFLLLAKVNSEVRYQICWVSPLTSASMALLSASVMYEAHNDAAQ
jgi:hypothetical protein